LDSDITLARALEEAKYLDTQIASLIPSLAVVSYKKKIVPHVAPSDQVNHAESRYREITEMIAQRDLLKQNTIRTNSATPVTMHLNDTDVTMPLAVLIESQLNIKPPAPKKSHSRGSAARRGGRQGRSYFDPYAGTTVALTFDDDESYEERLIKTIRSQLDEANTNVETKNQDVQLALNKLLEAGSAAKDVKSTDALEMDKKIESYRRNNTWVIRDPLTAKDECDKLEEEVEDFAAQQNSQLTIANANTRIPTTTLVDVPKVESDSTGSTTMLVAVALDELNRLHDRIMKKIYALKAVTSYRASDAQTEDFDVRARADYQSIRDLIRRRKLIRHALVQSNASTVINVAGETMTVAEAMFRKSRGIALERSLLQQMEATRASVTRAIDTHNAQLERRCEAKLKERLQDWTEEEKAAFTSAQREAEMHKLRRKDVVEMVDPINVDEKIEALRTKLTAFDREINHAITESNSRTLINF
jgi:hypothetical protein